MCRPPMISVGKLSERFLLSTVICIAFWGASLLQAPRVQPRWGDEIEAIPPDSACMHVLVAGTLPNNSRAVSLQDIIRTQ